MKPYAECVGNGHAGKEFGGILLILITGAVGLLGLVLLVLSLVVLFSKSKTSEQRKADFERKVVETEARDAAKEAAEQRQLEERMHSAASELADSVGPIRLARLGLTIHDGIIYTTGETLTEMRRGDIRPLGPLIGSHATFTKLKDKPPKRHSQAYDIAIGFYRGPIPRAAVMVTAGNKTTVWRWKEAGQFVRCAQRRIGSTHSQQVPHGGWKATTPNPGVVCLSESPAARPPPTLQGSGVFREWPLMS
jgi:hypothetical protein